MFSSLVVMCLFNKSMTLEKVLKHDKENGDNYLTLYKDHSQVVDVIQVTRLNGKDFYFCEKTEKDKR